MEASVPALPAEWHVHGVYSRNSVMPVVEGSSLDFRHNFFVKTVDGESQEHSVGHRAQVEGLSEGGKDRILFLACLPTLHPLSLEPQIGRAHV